LNAVLIDTHVWAWVLTEPEKLRATTAILLDQADEVCLSPVSIYEIAQKVRIGKWPEMARFMDQLDHEMKDQGVVIAPLTAQIGLRAGRLDWAHRDPFDRMIAATAMETDMLLISADTVFDALPIRRVW
jgi:PIN domain nuclease of toxin-antitoxin system